MAAPILPHTPTPNTYATAFAITKSDTVNFPVSANAIYVGTPGATGTVVVALEDGTTVNFVGVPAGTILPIRCIRVNNTTTTASDLVALV